MPLTKITSAILTDGAVTADKLASNAVDTQVSSYLISNSFATESYVDTSLANLVDSSPETLDTLNELATALGNDPSFATTITTSIGTKWTQDNTKIANWDNAFGWGDHSSVGYLTSSSTPGGSLTGSFDDVVIQYGTSYSGTPTQGSFFFDSLNQKLKVYTGSDFIDAIPDPGAGGGGEATDANTTFRKYIYTVASETNAVTGLDDNSETLSYVTDGTENVEVFVNGVKVVQGTDYVSTTGSSVAFTYNIPAGSTVEIQVYELLTNDAYYTKSEVYTKTETNTQISTAVTDLVDSSPTTLDTLNELAAALGDDPNFATTTANSIATKLTSNNTNASILDNAWAGEVGHPGYSGPAGNGRFGFSAPSGQIDIYADGNFYATDNAHKLWHAGDFANNSTNWNSAYSYSQIGHLPLAGGTVTGSLTIGNNSSRNALSIKSSSFSEVNFFTAGTEYTRIGTAETSSSLGLAEGDFFVYDNPTQKMNLIVKRGGDIVINHGHVKMDEGGIQFSRGSDDYSNYIRAANHPDEGYTTSTVKYWLELGSKGGTHVVLNTDGGPAAVENAGDHFNIWQGSITGDKLFNVSNVGRTSTKLRYEIGDSPIMQFLEITPVAHQVSFSNSIAASTTLPAGVPTDARYILVDVFITASVSDHQNFVFGDSTLSNQKNWVNTLGSNPANEFGSGVARNAVTLTYFGESDNFTSNYGIWYSSQMIPCSGRTLYMNNYGNSGSSGYVYMIIKGYSR